VNEDKISYNGFGQVQGNTRGGSFGVFRNQTGNISADYFLRDNRFVFLLLSKMVGAVHISNTYADDTP